MQPSLPSTITKTRLYAFGSNGSGQLGVGHMDDLSVPERCIFQKTGSSSGRGGERVTFLDDGHGIKKVVAGGNHTLILTSSGAVYAAGDDSDGRCYADGAGGLNSMFRRLEWKADNCDGSVITDVAATWEASFLVADGKKIYAFGSGGKGELGMGEGVVTMTTTKLVFDVTECTTEDDHGSHISSIDSGMNHIIVVLGNGSIYGWGACRKGQLGSALAATQKVCWRATKIEMPFRVGRAVCGRDFTFVQSQDDQCLLLGEHKKFPTVSLFQPSLNSQIQSGWSCVYSLREGELLVTGRNDRGQFPPVSVTTLKIFAAGSEHVIAQSTDSFVVAWGWGEHGNCGTPVDERGCVIGHHNVIDLKLDSGEYVSGVGAGCATSFVWTTQNG